MKRPQLMLVPKPLREEQAVGEILLILTTQVQGVAQILQRLELAIAAKEDPKVK